MKFPIKFFYFIGLTICSYLIGRVLYSSYISDNIFAIFIYGGLSLIWFICFYQVFKNERKNSKAKFKVIKYGISIVSVLTLVPIIVIFVYYQQKLNVPTLIKAQRHGVYAEFKTDGSYIIKSGAWGSRIHFYGKYILKDSIIQIDYSNLDKVLISNRFLIKHANLEEEKHRPEYDRITTEKYLVQIDREGKEINIREVGGEILPYKFEVVVDKRK